MALKPSQVRKRIADHVASSLGWVESAYSYDQFPGRESFDLIDKGYAVGLARTIPDTDDSRQRRGRPLHVFTEVRVRFSANVRPEEMVGDYDRALDLEHVLTQGVLDTPKAGGLQVFLLGVETRRSVLQGRAYLGEVRFSVRHMYELA